MKEEDISKAAEVIRDTIDADGYVPLKIFNSISQVTVLSPVDLYAFIKTPKGLRVVVSKRPENDEFLAGIWHIPGKIMIMTDESFSDTINRTMTSAHGIDSCFNFWDNLYLLN